MTVLNRTIGGAVAVMAMCVMVWASNTSITVHGSNQGVLRLAWSAQPERVEVCREQSADELAKLPQHMRQPLVCEGTSAGYRLTVRQAGRVVVDRTLHGGGVRQDRRLYVFQELALDPGETSIDVSLDRIESTEHRPGKPSAAATVPPHLSLAQRVSIRPREVLLVTYSPDRRVLIAIDQSSSR